MKIMFTERISDTRLVMGYCPGCSKINTVSDTERYTHCHCGTNSLNVSWSKAVTLGLVVFLISMYIILHLISY
jgi:hypothetical protein